MPDKVQVTLPPNMTQAEFEKLFSTFQKQRVATKVRDVAVRKAIKDTLNAHKEEYEDNVAKYLPKGK